MMKELRKLFLATGLFFIPLVASSQEDESINYLPATMETIVNDKDGRGIAFTELSPAEKRARVANSIFLYEGYSDADIRNAKRQNFLERYEHNLERELKDVNSFRFIGEDDYSVPEDLRAFPYEREAYSALGKTLIEKYKIARDIDKGIRKLRDATTVSMESRGGVRYRLGPFVGESELGALGIFLKIKAGKVNMVMTGCQNELEAYVEKKFGNIGVRGGYSYETGANDGGEKRTFYFSLQRKWF